MNARSSSLVNTATACAASGVFLPNFLPSARKFGFASSVMSASPELANSTVFTFNSAASSGMRGVMAASLTFGATQIILDSGCRTLIPTSSRAARPNRASSRIACMAASRDASAATGRSATNVARWTDVPVSSRWIQSLTNGAIGASKRQTDTSTSRSVANAARLSACSTS
jgi:hypothetical protein